MADDRFFLAGKIIGVQYPAAVPGEGDMDYYERLEHVEERMERLLESGKRHNDFQDLYPASGARAMWLVEFACPRK